MNMQMNQCGMLQTSQSVRDITHTVKHVFSRLLVVSNHVPNRRCMPNRGSINPLSPNVAYLQHETFSFMMSHPAMSLGDRLCASRKGGAGERGWVHPKGANSMAASGLSFEQPLVGAG